MTEDDADAGIIEPRRGSQADDVASYVVRQI